MLEPGVLALDILEVGGVANKAVSLLDAVLFNGSIFNFRNWCSNTSTSPLRFSAMVVIFMIVLITASTVGTACGIPVLDLLWDDTTFAFRTEMPSSASLVSF